MSTNSVRFARSVLMIDPSKSTNEEATFVTNFST